MIGRTLATSVLVLVGLAASSFANTIHVVDKAGGTFTSIQAAVNFAQSGDTIVVKPATTPYAGFTVVAKTLVIVGRTSSAQSLVKVQEVRVRNLAVTDTVSIRGFAIQAPAQGGEGALDAQDGAGHLVVEDCTIDAFFYPAFGPAIRLVDAGTATLTRCVAKGGHGKDLTDEFSDPGVGSGSHALLATNVDIALYACELTGGAGGAVHDTTCDSGGNGGAGIHATGCTISVCDVVTRGGNGGTSSYDVFCGAGWPGSGGAGAWLSQSFLNVVQSMFVGGFHGKDYQGMGGGKGPPVFVGPTSSVLYQTGVAARGIALPGGLVGSTTQSMRIETAAGDFAALFVGSEPTLRPAPVGVQDRLLGPPSTLLVLGSFAPAGFHDLPFTNPPATPALLGVPMHAQIVVLDAGGEVRFGGPTFTTMVQ